MTPNVAVPMSAAPQPAAHAAAPAAAGRDASPAAGTNAQDGFGHQFDQALKQQPGAPALAGAPAAVAVPPKAVLAQGEPGLPLADKDGEASTDPAERGGNALAAAVLALLGQGAALPGHAAAAASKGQSVSLDADKGGAQRGAAVLMATAAQGAGATDAAAPTAPIDAGALIATAPQAAAPEIRKEEQAADLEALAAPLSAHAPASGAAPPAHALKMDSPAGNPGFAQELGQQVAWLGGQEIKQARIRLRPEELGQLDVKVSMAEHGRVDVSFTAQHPAAVTAVQQTLGQLDLMLAGQGLSLGQAQVGQQSGGERGDGRQGEAQEPTIAETEPMSATTRTMAIGLLDTFA